MFAIQHRREGTARKEDSTTGLPPPSEVDDSFFYLLDLFFLLLSRLSVLVMALAEAGSSRVQSLSDETFRR